MHDRTSFVTTGDSMRYMDWKAAAAADASNLGFHLGGAPGHRAPRILVISRDRHERLALREFCAASNWSASEAGDWRDTVLALSRTGADVILCDDRLPDGTWKDVLSVLAPLPESPRLIVVFDDASPAEWSEVLNLGGFDVLNKPLHAADVNRAIAAAWRSLEDGRMEERRRR